MSAIKKTRRVRTLAMTVGLVLGMAAGTLASASAQAQEAAPSGKTLRKAKATKKEQVKAKAVKLAPLPEATPEQVAAAERVLIGRYECEFKKTIEVDKNDANPGYINLRLGKQNWVMKPVVSPTGAIRLEDVKEETLLVQILTKSMLLNVKSGQRMVDGCVHEVQRKAEEELRKNPRPSVFDAAPSASAASAAN
ncbi:MAG: hypothetical protein EOP38_20925 [Rubrivivax sp.]|nr:MAG: hypothetical protein EOP38_20925 [Rubrivivax sp.]